MRSLLTVIIFLALIMFCVSWFNENNPDRTEFAKIPYVGPYVVKIIENYGTIFEYSSRGPSAILEDVKDSVTFKDVINRLKSDAQGDLQNFKEIYQKTVPAADSPQ